MGLSTLAGHSVTSARAWLPAWGRWYADATLDGEHVLVGRVELKLSDLSLSGTVLSGGPFQGRSHYRIVSGAGGWGRTIPAESYQDDAGVKVSTVLGDAAKAAGETLDTSTLTASSRLDSRYTRPEDPASRVLELYAPRAWYVDEAGVTRLGARVASALASKPTIGARDPARGTVSLASDLIAKILPGVVIEGVAAVDVLHELTETKIRSTIWGAVSAGESSRMLEAFRQIIEQLDPSRRFRGVTEYRVVEQEGNLLNLQPVLVSIGMPDLPRVAVWPGVSGCKADVSLGSSVLVGFINADPSRPYVAAHENADGAGFVPSLLQLAGGADFVALAAKVSTELGHISTALTTHVHGGVTTGGGVSGVAPGVYTPGSVAASKVKAS